MTGEPAYRLTLTPQPAPGGVPVIVRLRRALKCLLRSYKLRCVEAEQVEADGTAIAYRGGYAECGGQGEGI